MSGSHLKIFSILRVLKQDEGTALTWMAISSLLFMIQKFFARELGIGVELRAVDHQVETIGIGEATFPNSTTWSYSA